MTTYLLNQDKNVILLCSGWKNAFNFEDTLFAGAVVKKLLPNFSLSDHRDAALAAMHLFDLAKGDLYNFLDRSSHRKRLERLHVQDDIVFCLKQNMTDIVPVMIEGVIYNSSVLESI